MLNLLTNLLSGYLGTKGAQGGMGALLGDGTGMDGGPGVLPPKDGGMMQVDFPDGVKPAAPFPIETGPDYINMSQPILNQQQQQSEQGILGPVARPAQQMQAKVQQPQGDPRQLMNFTGLLDNPNALVRAAGGYNMGGLLGSLGYLLTDMNPNSQGNLHQAQMTDEARRFSQQNRLQ